MRTTLLFCAALLAAPIGTGYAQAVWKWKDERGVTHYADQPGHPSAVRVDIATSQTYSSDEARTNIDVDTSSSQPRRTVQPAESYSSLRITQPSDDQTMFASEGSVNIQVSLEPGLQPGHSMQILFDGRNISGENSSSLSASLPEVDRGSHSVQARVVDASGETVASSTPVTFHVQQTSINSPAYNSQTGPNRPRPQPPRPQPVPRRN